MNYIIISKLESNYLTKEYAGLGRYWIRRELSREDGIVTALESTIDHEPTDEDYENLYNSYLTSLKNLKIKEVVKYDTSSEVNSFYYDNKPYWLDKLTRNGVAYAANVEKRKGLTTSKLYLSEGLSVELPIDLLIDLLDQLEIYALECYRTTEMHKENINNLSDAESIKSYDITSGYPDKLVINKITES